MAYSTIIEMAETSEGLARRVVAILKTRGHQAYLVGGCVRDMLLHRVPEDFDVATNAVPARVLELFPRGQLVGAHFGVVLIVEGQAQVEVATFRRDHAYLDGRRPERVEFETDPRQDVLRRDFTINALLMDAESGEILDFVGGRADLERGLLRAIGNAEARFGEDHLRMLRAVRFAARFGFEIEPATFEAIEKLHELIVRVSSERVRDELIRILTEGGARTGFQLLDRSGLLQAILPEVAAMKGVEQPPQFHPEGDVWIHTLLMLEAMRSPTASLALGVLLHDVGKPPTFRVEDRIRFDGHAETGAQMAVEILTRLRASGELTARVEALVANHLRFKDVERMRESTLKRFLRMEHFDEHLELHRLDCVASHRRLEHYQFLSAKLEEYSAEILKPPPLITGRDLIEAGYQPGPSFAAMLQAVEDAQLEGRIGTRAEALAWVESLFTRPKPESYNGL